MAKKKTFWIMLGIALAFGMALVGCDDGGDDTPSSTDLTGTWEASGGRVIVFTGNTFSYTVNGSVTYSGTFSTSGSTITFTIPLGSASGNFQLSGGSLVLSNHTWDSSVNGTYTKITAGSGRTITITGITQSGTVTFAIPSQLADQSLTAYMVSAGTGTVSNNSVTIRLKRVVNSAATQDDWTGTGEYFMYFQVNSSSVYLYTEGKTFAELGISSSSPTMSEFNSKLPRYNFPAGNITIAFDQFKLVP